MDYEKHENGMHRDTEVQQRIEGKLAELPCKVGEPCWIIAECGANSSCILDCSQCNKMPGTPEMHFVSRLDIAYLVDYGAFCLGIYGTPEAAQAVLDNMQEEHT